MLVDIVRSSFRMRRTRILATVGPASDGPDQIAALLAAGSDGFRLNFSHGTADAHAGVCRRIREAATAVGRHVAVLQDLGGPKIRIGPVAEPMALEAGDVLTIEPGEFSGAAGRVSCSFEALFSSVRPGERLLINDGRLAFDVLTADRRGVRVRALNGGRLEGRKGVNLPDSHIDMPSLTGKDVDDLAAGVAMGVDMAALSFVQSGADVRAARAAARAAGSPDLPIIAKIERPQAVDRIDEILPETDGIMIARGDLGIELPLATLPSVQKRLVAAARRQGLPVIVATEVLESMRTEPRPTRAEVTDAAHAVDERVDTIMLAGETAVGRYPVRAVEALDAIIREAEKAVPVSDIQPAPAGGDHGWAVCEAAVALAGRAGASAIVALTQAGKTARMLAALRPSAAIVAATERIETAARLSLTWGVTAVQVEPATIASARDLIVSLGLATAGQTVVFVAVNPVLDLEETNFVQVQRI